MKIEVWLGSSEVLNTEEFMTKGELFFPQPVSLVSNENSRIEAE